MNHTESKENTLIDLLIHLNNFRKYWRSIMMINLNSNFSKSYILYVIVFLQITRIKNV